MIAESHGNSGSSATQLHTETVVFAWLDLEMTGLNPEKDRILEVALIVTDEHSNEKGRFETAVFQPQNVLDGMDEWCQKHHGESGLTARVPGGLPESEVDQKLRAVLDTLVPKGRPILAGNSIAQDRRFVDRYLPLFAARLHYRMLDVSSFKVIFESRFHLKFQKQNKHRALEDIHESMAELEFYLTHLNPERPVPAGGKW